MPALPAKSGLISLLGHAEDAPQAAVEPERTLVAVEVVARPRVLAPGPVLEQEVEVRVRPDAIIGALPLRERVAAEHGRVVDVGLLLPDVAVHLEDVVAGMAARVHDAEAHRLTGGRSEE